MITSLWLVSFRGLLKEWNGTIRFFLKRYRYQYLLSVSNPKVPSYREFWLHISNPIQNLLLHFEIFPSLYLYFLILSPDGTDGPQTKEPQQQEPPDMDGDNNEYPSVVVYVVDPFTYGNDWEDINRLSTLGLLRCYQEMLTFLPEQIRSHVKLQVITLKHRYAHIYNI